MATEDAPVQKVRVVSELPDIILTWFVSITGLAAALIFGVFAVLSWIDSQHAKAQANASNLIALAAICAQVNVRTLVGSRPLQTLQCMSKIIKTDIFSMD